MDVKFVRMLVKSGVAHLMNLSVNKRSCGASQRILARHQAQDSLSEDEIAHDLKQQAKLDKSADKIKEFLATNEEKLCSQRKPVKSNITDSDSAKMTTSKGC